MKVPALFMLLATAAFAEVPTKKPVEDYDLLWTRSPFTGSAAEANKTPAISTPLASVESISDWSLRGISQFAQGPQVTIACKSKPERIEILKPGEKGIFTVVSIDRGNGSLEDIAVTVTDGQKTETLRFDKDLISPHRPVVKTPDAPPRAILIPDS
jgi:hypothetical protein